MTESTEKKLNCIICHSDYQPVFAPAEDENGYRIFCSSELCARSIFLSAADPVRVALRSLYDIHGEALALAVEEALADCPCGARFEHTAGRRCAPCVEKIENGKKDPDSMRNNVHLLWSTGKLRAHEDKLSAYLLEKMEGGSENLQQLIARFEAGEIPAEEYMERLENIQQAESRQFCVIKTLAMAAGAERAFHLADVLGLAEHYGTRVLVAIASGLETATGVAALTTLAKEISNLDGVAQKELRTYLAKIGKA